jgi:hypothetical protein
MATTAHLYRWNLETQCLELYLELKDKALRSLDNLTQVDLSNIDTMTLRSCPKTMVEQSHQNFMLASVNLVRL